MKDRIIEIKNVPSGIVITKYDKTFCIEKHYDNDIWFTTNVDNLEINLDFYSNSRIESKIYEYFESLMKRIFGRFVMIDSKDEWSTLPKDFVDLRENKILWHSDGGLNCDLKLEYCDKEIKISLISKKHGLNKVRIRTSGSDYERYYQEFEKFFQDLYKLCLNEPKEEPKKQEEPKRRLIFGKKSKN